MLDVAIACCEAHAVVELTRACAEEARRRILKAATRVRTTCLGLFLLSFYTEEGGDAKGNEIFPYGWDEVEEPAAGVEAPSEVISAPFSLEMFLEGQLLMEMQELIKKWERLLEVLPQLAREKGDVQHIVFAFHELDKICPVLERHNQIREHCPSPVVSERKVS